MINFVKPTGFFQQIDLNCTVMDNRCSTPVHINRNCSDCSSFNISTFERGSQYSCSLSTLKLSFTTELSDFTFNTSQLNEMHENTLLFLTTFFLDLTAVAVNSLLNPTSTNSTFSVNVSSDYSQLRTACVPSTETTDVCSSLNVSNKNCEKEFDVNGNYGCTYTCVVTTEKQNYTSVNSSAFTWIIGSHTFEISFPFDSIHPLIC